MRFWERVLGACLAAGVLSLAHAGLVRADEHFKPFVLASRGPGDFDAKVAAVKDALAEGGFELLGEYVPYDRTFVDKAHVVVVTNDELKQVAAMSKYGGFAAPWRVAITEVGDDIQVAYANPEYIANAYRLKSDLKQVATALQSTLGAQQSFGAEKGLTAPELRNYHYAFGMEYFDNPYQLAKYDNYQQAVDAVEKNLALGIAGVTKVYRVDLPGEVTVFGVARKAPSEADIYMDEALIMEEVDHGELKGTAYLPYEIMVEGREVVALNMRFRMAVHYPDLKMVGAHSFMGIMNSPAAIQKALTEVAGGD
jgi:hypothetical protein